jgi:chromate transporter
MNVVLLYLLLLKATLTSFSGLSSLPVVRGDLVVHHKLITDRQLNAAVAAGRVGTGPLGLYIVSVGYFAAGIPGACVGCLALMTPAFLIIPMLRYLGSRAESPRLQRTIRTVILAAAGLVLAATVPLARDAITGTVPLAIAVVSFALLTLTRIDTFWVMAGSAAAGLLAGLFT